MTFAWPAATALVLLYIIAFWALVTGIFEIVAAVRLRRQIENEWRLGLAGALSVLFGLYLIASPSAGALAVVTLIAIYAVLFGIMLIALSLRLRSVSQQEPAAMPAAAV